MSQPATIVTYFDDPSPMGYPFTERNYFISYKDFNTLCKDHDVDFYIARGPESYSGNMHFRSAWKFKGDQLYTVNHPIRADVIYDKGTTLQAEASAIIVNHPTLMALCRDKLKTYDVFSEDMPLTVPLTFSHWREAVQHLPGDQIVIKPVMGMEGTGITIVRRAEFHHDDLDPQLSPYLAQEFIDCSTGISGLVEGRHDLRVYIFNGEVKAANIRQPRAGQYLANIAQGGSMTILSLKQVPDWAVTLAKKIDQSLQQYHPRIYSIDFMYGNGRPYLVELNGRPGFPYPAWSYYHALHRYIFETLMTAPNI